MEWLALTALTLAAGTAHVGCAQGGVGADQAARDVAVGPLVIIGAQRTIGRHRDAFGRHGYKLPVTLPEGVTATLSSTSRDVGFVFTQRAQDRAWKRGVSGANAAVRFTACEGDRSTLRTGWPGGIVVSRPLCATLVVDVEQGPTERRRVPLGRAC